MEMYTDPYKREYPEVELRIELDPNEGGFLVLLIEDKKNNLFVGAKVTPDAAIKIRRCLEEELDRYFTT